MYNLNLVLLEPFSSTSFSTLCMLTSKLLSISSLATAVSQSSKYIFSRSTKWLTWLKLILWNDNAILLVNKPMSWKELLSANEHWILNPRHWSEYKCKFVFCPKNFLVQLTIARWEVIFKMVKKINLCRKQSDWWKSTIANPHVQLSFSGKSAGSFSWTMPGTSPDQHQVSDLKKVSVLRKCPLANCLPWNCKLY